MSRLLPLIISILLVLALVGTFVWLLFDPLDKRERRVEVRFERASLTALPGWSADSLAGFRAALDRSCERWPNRSNAMGPAMASACADLPGGGDAALKAHLADHWTAWRIEAAGRLTGYFEPVYRGARTQSAAYPVPLHRVPDDLITARLSDFDEDLKGTIRGRLQGSRLVPYHDRKAIREGALAGRDLELIWLADPVDAFFLQIQGSGRIVLPDGSTAHIGYASQNGRPYRAIGRDLIERGFVPREQMSMQAIRGWLTGNPGAADAIMDLNQSYVFFTERDQAGAIGAEGVVLTAERSIAVDRRTWLFGLPFWIDAGEGMRKLTVGQDTGGAIRGAARADYFAGTGDAAGDLAGGLNRKLTMYLLLPNGVDPETALRR